MSTSGVVMPFYLPRRNILAIAAVIDIELNAKKKAVSAKGLAARLTVVADQHVIEPLVRLVRIAGLSQIRPWRAGRDRRGKSNLPAWRAGSSPASYRRRSRSRRSPCCVGRPVWPQRAGRPLVTGDDIRLLDRDLKTPRGWRILTARNT